MTMLINENLIINIKSNDGSTGFLFACQQGHIDVVKLLIDKGIDINIKDINGERDIVSIQGKISDYLTVIES